MNHQDLTLMGRLEDLIEHRMKVVCHRNNQEVDSLDDEMKVLRMQQNRYGLHNPLN